MERAVFGTILEMREEKHEVGRNVATSGQHEEEVNKWPMSRPLNDAMPQRRDVSAISPSQEKGTRIRGYQRTYEQGHGKQSSSDPGQR